MRIAELRYLSLCIIYRGFQMLSPGILVLRALANVSQETRAASREILL